MKNLVGILEPTSIATHDQSSIWLCTNCNLRLKTIDFAKNPLPTFDIESVDFVDKRYSYATLDVGEDVITATLLNTVRRWKSCDWEGPYCVVCLRVGIELGRMLQTDRNRDHFQDLPIRWKYRLLMGENSTRTPVKLDRIRFSTSRRVIVDLLLSSNEQTTNLAPLLWGRQVVDRTDISIPWPDGLEKCFEYSARSGWIEEALESDANHSDLELDMHSGCRDADEKRSRWAPDRLLMIVKEGKSVRLQTKQSQDFNDRVDYVTLSHRWGKPIRWTVLTATTQPDLLAGVPIDLLGKTFRDAIDLTWRLKFKYIWIDSLCIVQDSTLDWQVQSAVMGRIYEHAVLNIAALETDSDAEGMMPISDPCVLTSFSYQDAIATGDELRRALACTWRSFPPEHDRLPLLSRGWVFQEQAFSKRALLIHDLGWQWACPTDLNDLWTIYSAAESTERKLELDSILSRSIKATIEEQPSSMVKDIGPWMELVQLYSETYLTYPTDRIIALSSIAEKFGLNYSCRYLAGLFEHDLVRQLAWRIDGAYIEQSPKVYAAPSWSWASVNNIIRYEVFRYKDSIPLADFIDADIELVNPDVPYGQIRFGHLSLLGACWQMIPHQVSSEDRAEQTFQQKDFLLDGLDLGWVNRVLTQCINHGYHRREPSHLSNQRSGNAKSPSAPPSQADMRNLQDSYGQAGQVSKEAEERLASLFREASLVFRAAREEDVFHIPPRPAIIQQNASVIDSLLRGEQAETKQKTTDGPRNVETKEEPNAYAKYIEHPEPEFFEMPILLSQVDPSTWPAEMSFELVSLALVRIPGSDAFQRVGIFVDIVNPGDPDAQQRYFWISMVGVSEEFYNTRVVPRNAYARNDFDVEDAFWSDLANHLEGHRLKEFWVNII